MLLLPVFYCICELTSCIFFAFKNQCTDVDDEEKKHSKVICLSLSPLNFLSFDDIYQTDRGKHYSSVHLLPPQKALNSTMD